MERDSPEYDAMILALGKYAWGITGRKVEGPDFQAGWQAALAYVREGVEWKKGSLEEVGTTDRGYTIFREVNEVGGHRYWSDEIGGGVVAWDTCLVDAGTLRECLRIEEGPVTESSGCVFRDLNVSPPEKE